MTEVQSSPGRERSAGLSLSEVIPAVERRPPDPQPANRAPAPGDLQLVQALVNSFHNLDTRREEFDSPAGLTDWLIRRELLDPGERLTHADLTRVLDVREGLRMRFLYYVARLAKDHKIALTILLSALTLICSGK